MSALSNDPQVPSCQPGPLPASDGHPPGPFHVVGIGASAGGLEALELFFRHLPPDTGMAFVVVQHLSPDFKSHMEELLARETSLPIRRVEDGMAVEPNSVYLIPPKKEMIISGGRLRLTDKEPERGLTLPIDVFFRSLAHDRGPLAVGVVLSGTGSDGSRGVRAIHEAGGLVIAQSEETAKFDGMPLNAQATGVVDLVLPPEAIPAVLERYARDNLSPQALAEHEVPAAEAEGLQAVFRLLRTEYSIDFSHYKSNTIGRRVQRRLALGRAPGLDAYCDRLRHDREELDALYRDLLIGVTRFFRDQEAFGLIEREVIPDVLARVAPSDPIRVWVAGCATGEEAYSLAMLFHEQINAAGRPLHFKMFATDAHRNSLEFAAAGSYPEEALAEVSPARRARYFKKERDRYHVVSELRQMIVFAPHNVISDAPFTQLDLVSCRNLLIYLQPAAQRKALSLFHFALKTGGVLFLGPSETPGEFADEFEPLDKRWKLYRKRRDVRLPGDLRMGLSVGPSVLPREVPRREPGPAGLADHQLLAVYDRLLERYVPPSFLLDDRFQLVHTFGGAERLLHHRGGRPSMNVLDLVPEDLKTPLAGALNHALREGTPVRYTGVTVRTDQGEEQFRLLVQPLHDQRTKTTHLSVELESLGASAPPRERPAEADIKEMSREHIRSLEVELRYTRENLQATIEELETANEELQAANEELVASNEELQSTNEELHSVNEELYSVNAEHQRKIEELTELTDDMNNLLATTQVGVIFLDRELCIRRFTPAIARIFHLLPQDLGRRIDSFAHNLEHPDLLDDVRGVLAGEAPLEKEVRDHLGNQYLMRVLPYRTVSAVEGVVLTLIDINSLKKAESELARFKFISDHATDMHALVDADGRLVYVNRALCEGLGYGQEELLRMRMTDLYEGIDRPRFRDLFDHAQAEAVPLFESALMGKDGSATPVEISATGVEFAGRPYLFTATRDITERKKGELELQESLERYGLALAAGGMGTWEWNVPEDRMTWSDELYALLGVDPEQFEGTLDAFLGRIVPADRDAVRAAIDEALRTGGTYSMNCRVRHGQGGVRWIYGRGKVQLDPWGRPWRILGVCSDETERKEGERRLRQLAAIVEATSDFVGTCTADGRITSLNRAGRRMAGLGEDEDLSGLDIARLHPEESLRLIREEGFPTAAREGSWQGETVLKAGDGREIALSQVILAHKDTRGRVEFYSTIGRDITERKRIEQEMALAREAADAASRAKSDFLTRMSHELRTPLNAVIGMSRMLSTQHLGPLNAKQQDYLKDIQHAGEHLLGLINDILDLSRVEAGKLVLSPEPFAAGEEVAATLGTIRNLAESKGLSLLEGPPPDDAVITHDRGRFRQVLLNLLSNAMKFTPGGGRVTVSWRWVGERDPDAPPVPAAEAAGLRVEVEDTGVGIPLEEQPRVWEEFHQVTNGGSPKTEGTGLGLPLCRRLLARMGGDIWMRSEPGAGTCFTFVLPTHAPADGDA